MCISAYVCVYIYTQPKEKQVEEWLKKKEEQARLEEEERVRKEAEAQKRAMQLDQARLKVTNIKHNELE